MSPYGHLVGHRFPGGTFTLEPHIAWLWSECVLADPRAAVAHPSLGWFVAMRGCGFRIQDVFDLMDADAGSGPLLGEMELEFGAPLRPGATYELEGEIAQVERKRGRRAGVFDRVALRISLSEPGAEPTCTLTNVLIFPRAEA